MNGEDSKRKSRWILSWYVFAYAWVCWRPYMWKLKYGARAFCMPRMKWSKSKAAPIVLLEWLPCFSLASNKSANARNARLGLQAIGGFFMFSFFSLRFPFLCAHKTHFVRYRKVGKSKGNKTRMLGLFRSRNVFYAVSVHVFLWLQIIPVWMRILERVVKSHRSLFFCCFKFYRSLTHSLSSLSPFFFSFLLQNSTRNIKKCM